MWEAATGGIVEASGAFPDEARSVVFSPDGTKLAAYCRTLRIHLWQITRQQGKTVFTEQESIRDVIGWGMDFLDDGKLVGIRYFGQERVICDISRAGFERVKAGASAVATTLLVPDDEGLVLTARSDDSPRKVSRWRISDDEISELGSFQSDFDIGCLAISSSGVWAIGERGGSRIRLYKDPFGISQKQPVELEVRAKDARIMAFSRDGAKLLVGFKDGGIVVCQELAPTPFSWEILKQWDGERGAITAAAFHPVEDTRVVTGSHHGVVTVWNLDQEPSAEDLLRDAVPILGGVCISPEGERLFAYPFNSKCYCWEWSSRQQIPDPGHQALAGWPRYLPDGQTIVSLSDGARTLRLFDLEVWQIRCSLQGGSSIFTGLSVSPDGNVIAAGDRDGTIHLFRRASKEAVEKAGW